MRAAKTRGSKSSTPRPSTGDKSGEASRPLNVTDALGYLDAVKLEFQDNPEVYNNFLDIMKDFKSQKCVLQPYHRVIVLILVGSIDTPGVINRVSRLFQGNAILIEGFNTFLPAGYRIEVNDPRNPNNITVLTPLGIIHPGQLIPGLGPNISQPFPVADPYLVGTHGSLPGSRAMTPNMLLPQGAQPTLLGSLDQQPLFTTNPQTSEAASFLGNLNSTEKNTGNNTEFYHAIKYLNRIKARFDDENNTYKQFLDILQSYQKDQKNLTDVCPFVLVATQSKS